ncbi:uncharacterized protein LOC129560765 [Moschus berezovskii]|uniref:uncharacterized protein LOC129560765 n=1 Tax=Moschus berezovskii TaxID=68408 RepID=UPI002443A314|nr:uncharacterized protein LOC129560765 [Moschus berezovskii]
MFMGHFGAAGGTPRRRGEAGTGDGGGGGGGGGGNNNSQASGSSRPPARLLRRGSLRRRKESAALRGPGLGRPRGPRPRRPPAQRGEKGVPPPPARPRPRRPPQPGAARPPARGSPGRSCCETVVLLASSVCPLMDEAKSLWVPHLVGMGFDFIVIAPASYHLTVAASLSLDMEYLFFFSWFQHPPVNGCSTAS